MDPQANEIAREIIQRQPQTPEEVAEQLNLIERLVGALDPRDDYDRAILEAINALREAVDPDAGVSPDDGTSTGGGGVSAGVDTSSLAIGLTGLAAEPVESGAKGLGVFQIDGSDYTVEFEAKQRVAKRDAITIVGAGNVVEPLQQVGDVLGDPLVSTAGDFEVKATSGGAGTNGAIIVEPGETRTIVSAEADGGFWYFVGTSDQPDSTYRYVVDGEPIFEDSQQSPLGLFNDPFRFPKPLAFEESIEIEVSLDAAAGGNTEYVSKIGYQQ